MNNPWIGFSAKLGALLLTGIFLECWRETGLFSTTTAAWAQAIGTMVAIGAAAWIASGEARREANTRDEDRRHVAKLALTIMGSAAHRLADLEAMSVDQFASETTVTNLAAAADALARLPLHLVRPVAIGQAAYQIESRVRLVCGELVKARQLLGTDDATGQQRLRFDGRRAVVATHSAAVKGFFTEANKVSI